MRVVASDGEVLWTRSSPPRSVDEREAAEREFYDVLYAGEREAMRRLGDPAEAVFSYGPMMHHIRGLATRRVL